MDQAAHVPQLAEDAPTRRVHRLHDRHPGGDLLTAPDAGGVGPP
jgi:hypothetical protein